MDAQLLKAVPIVLALVVVAGFAALFVARYISLRRSVSIENKGTLSDAERRGLKAWARRTKVAFAEAMLFVALNGILLIVTNPAPLWLGWLGLGAANGYRGCGIGDPLLRAVSPLWLHDRSSESPFAPTPLREVQNAFPLAPASR